MEYKSDLAQEKKHLQKTISVIEESLNSIKKERDDKTELLKELSRKFTSATPEFYNDIPITLELVKLYTKMARDYETARSKPYFGKLNFDLLPEKENIVLYIGKYGIDDFKKSGSASTLVIDWRAAVSDLYYSTSFGKTGYEAPGGYIEVDVNLKTSFDIEKGELLGIYDSDIMANDDLLIKYLSRKKDTVLNDIVATIQKDQNTIIRLTPFKNLMVQGVAGSGKTTVAIHRIAYLLYNYSQYLTMDNIYVIASSKLFLNYITSMLPDLDVPSIKQGTLTGFLMDVIREFDPHFHCAVTDESWVYTAEETAALLLDIRAYFAALEHDFFKKEDAVMFFGVTVLSREFIAQFLNTRARQKLLDKTEELDKLLKERLYALKEIIIDYIADNRENEKIQAYCRNVFKLEPTSIFADNLSKRYAKLVATYKKHFTSGFARFDYLSVFRSLTGKPGKKTGTPQLSAQELSVLMLIVNELKHLKSARNIRHIVIDEAQDFSPLIYCCLSSVFAKANFTLVGDVMQNISDGGLSTWDEVAKLAFHHEADLRTLTKSYRNTIEISRFAKNLVARYSDFPLLIEPVIRNGRSVCFYKTNDKVALVLRLLRELHESAYNMSAVIFKDDVSADRFCREYRAAAQSSDPRLVRLSPESGLLESGSYVLSLKDSKGLEFDGVILPDFDAYQLGKPSGDLKRVYVAITRALHELHILTNREDISFLAREVSQA
jgi:DNA helicase-2/ATP-dependent DNA helicase PcrA